MRHAVVVTLVGFALTSQAATVTVHKCRTVAGNVVYQSTACPPGERTLAAWDAPSDPPVPAASMRRLRDAARSAERRSGTRGRTRSRAAAVASVDECAAAKARRDEIERRVGLARTYELLSALNREVFDACK